jgi:hypothetical protein
MITGAWSDSYLPAALPPYPFAVRKDCIFVGVWWRTTADLFGWFFCDLSLGGTPLTSFGCIPLKRSMLRCFEIFHPSN